MKKSILYFVIYFLIIGCTSSEKTIYVKDNARVLSSEFVKSCNQYIHKKYKKSKVQFIVYTISSIGNIKSLEKYTSQLIEKTDFGKTGFSQSVIMILYPDEGSFFVRWGNMLKDRIDNFKVNSIIDSARFYFQKNDFNNGIKYSVGQIYSLIE